MRVRRFKHTAKRLLAWWSKRHRAFGWRWMAATYGAAAVVLALVILPFAHMIAVNNSYKISAATLKLVGKANSTLGRQLTFNDKKKAYQYNQSSVKTASTQSPFNSGQVQLGSASGGASDKSLFALDLPQDIKQGVTYYDTNSQLNFSLTPEFAHNEGRNVNGRMVYPMGGGATAIYTVKSNGLKEDIVVEHPGSSDLSYDYKLTLPDTLQAKMIPNQSGAIGIYSADPSLFGSITYGSDADKQRVELARKTAAKSYLVFALPAPIVKDLSGKTVGNAHFKLSGNTITVVAGGLKNVKGPVTIDPSVVVTSTSDFSNGNLEDNIDLSTPGQINRSVASGGGITTGFNTGSSLPAGVEAAQTAIYNGYIYEMGGYKRSTGNYSTVQFAQLNSDGSLGTWTATTSLPSSIIYGSGGAYNGYLYVFAGQYSGGSYNNVLYAPIYADGTIGLWSATSSLPVNITGGAATIYNGYAYEFGGAPSSPGGCGANNNCYNSVYYAKINANGTLGTWTTTTSFTTARALLSATSYNGYVYIMGGGGNGYLNDVQYAPINSDGSIGTWVTTNAFNAVRYGSVVSTSNGYIYIAAGVGAGGYRNDIQYASINANGSISPWTTASSTITNGRTYGTGGAYNGYYYVIGGWDGSNDYSDVQYAKIDPTGALSAFNTTTVVPTTSLTTACSIAYKGYMYVYGGYTGSAPTNAVKYAPINTNGTLGTWTTSANNLNTATYLAGCAVYNDYLYIIGGINSGGSYISTTQYAAIATTGVPGTWATTTALPTNGGQHPAVAYNGFIYFRTSGGGGPTTSVYYAPLNTNGTIGTWATTSSLNTTRTGEGFMAYGHYMYALAGNNGSTSTVASTEYALINADGTLGPWTLTSSLNLGRDRFTFGAVGGYIYVVGGEINGSVDTATTEFAPINSDGSIGTWSYGTSLPATYSSGGNALYNGTFYTVSGKIGGARSTAVYYGSVGNGGNGTVNGWTASSTTIPTGRYGQGSVAYNGYLYEVAGHIVSGGTSSNVQYAPINGDGSLGTWVTNSATLNTGRSDFGLVAYNGYLYAMGGLASGQPRSDYEYAPINSNGSIGTWTAVSNAITARYLTDAVAYNGYMYIGGGCTSVSVGACNALTNTVQVATINSNGSLGTFSSLNTFSGARVGAKMAAYNGYLYVIAGCTVFTSNACTAAGVASDVQVAPINSDGTIGTWTDITSIQGGRLSPTVSVANGYIYIAGGRNSTTIFGDVQVASINKDGSFGDFTATATLPTTRFSAGSAIYNGVLYVGGGCNSTSTNCGSSLLTDVQYSPLTAPQRIAHYSKIFDLGALRNITGISYNGNLPGTSTATYRTAGLDGNWSASAPISSFNGSGIATGCASGSSSFRYVMLSFALDDSGTSASTTFPDVNTGNAYLSDATITYAASHPSPSIRLRGGKTLQTGTQSGLDTCSVSDLIDPILTSNLYLQYNFTSGTSDSSSSGNNGIITGGATTTVDRKGIGASAYNFDGSSGYVSSTNATNNPAVFTINIWFRTTTTSGGKLVGLGSSKTGASSNYDRHIYMTNSGQLYFGVYTGSTVTINTTNSYNDGNWHMATGVLSSAGMALYVDGTLQATGSNTVAQNFNGYWRVGYDTFSGWPGTASSYYFNGILDDVSIYGVSLTGAQIQELYNL